MDMNLNDQLADDLLIDDNVEVGAPPQGFANKPRLPQMMRRIPVTLTLEVGSARISLQDLMDLGPASVLPLDAVAGEPLVIKVNGAPIGRAEVVVAGEQYGLKVIDLDGLNLDVITA
ncbi:MULTISPECIES: FliM/FliN family flagellar motor switch protein [unclassified Massilia]|uniref:FliM/FliN family flagellar motor switch protein n=1 Tax=unclassified Massilia TaxID=2609279 RepID=UPI0017816D56|nr:MULTISPECIES: FliM/FliN family flagellar motor switch protein [unclassified Massilia]MBD8528975.1 FliM/FliN family flagellar motor switch protein [Massilia sp. CFBP 13647]MBD8672369.1 FliM/FliN family flagellar motor switch protein [Massilia sp. CFBP 13721]